MKEKQLIMVPGPTNVPDSVTRAMFKPMVSHRSSAFRNLYESIIENMRYLFQTGGEVYVLVASGTGGVECIVGNTVNTGDKIVTPVFGLFSERLKDAIIRRGGIPLELSLRWGTAPTADQIRGIIEKETEVKAIAVVYNETSTGVTVRDLQEIGEIAKEHNLLFIVDAVSILGGDELPVDKWNVDICVTASQKCLACPPGLALVSVSQNAWESIEKTDKPFYFDMLKMRSFREKNETPFTPAIPLFFALDEALKIIREEGLKNRFKRHRTCSKAFYEAVKAIELKPFPDEKTRSNTVIAFKKPEGINNINVRKVMSDHYDVVISGGSGKLKETLFRIGCMGTISETKVIRTIYALENALAYLGYSFERGAATEAARKEFHL